VKDMRINMAISAVFVSFLRFAKQLSLIVHNFHGCFLSGSNTDGGIIVVNCL